MEVVLILGIHVLVVVLLLLGLFLVLLLLPLILLLLFLSLILLCLILLLLLLLLSLIRYICTSAVISGGIVVQFNSLSRSTVVPVWSSTSTAIISVSASSSVMRRAGRIVRRTGRIMRGSFEIIWTTTSIMMRWTSSIVVVWWRMSVVWVVYLWWGTHMRVLVVVLIVQRLLHAMLLLVEQVSHLVNQMLIRGDVQVDQGLEHLLAVIVLGDLEGDQRIDIHWAQAEAVGGNGTEIGIDSGIGAVGIEGIAVGGVGKAEGDAKRGLYLLAQYASDSSATEALCAVEVQKTLKQYFANYSLVLLPKCAKGFCFFCSSYLSFCFYNGRLVVILFLI